ncbi:MAG: M48 family metalloprotease [Streptobacillus sp.]
MYVIDFLKNLFKSKNMGIIIYFIMNIIIITLMCVLITVDLWKAILSGIILYLVSISFALSKWGEYSLRRTLGCKSIEYFEGHERVRRLFNEVYDKVKVNNPEINSDIEIFMSNEECMNAFATGRRTICLTKGLLNLSDEEIKGVLAHEFSHILHKDTDYALVIIKGNAVVNLFFIGVRLGIYLSKLRTKDKDGYMLHVLADIVLTVGYAIWTKFGTLLVLWSSRNQEYRADKYACEIGYGKGLYNALDTISKYSIKIPRGILSTLMSDHPRTEDRLIKIEENLEN